MTPRVGVSLPQFTDDPGAFAAGIRRAEEVGLDSAWVFDHLWPLTGGKERPILECWTALAWAAATTDRIGVGTLVTRAGLRPPALLARMAATVASSAPGRLTLGIGGGDELSRKENESFGYVYRDDERSDELAEAVGALRSHFGGNEPLPARALPEAAPKVWVAGRSPVARRLAARLGDAWNGWGGTPARFRRDADHLRAEAGERDVEATWAGTVILSEDDDAARARLRGKPGDRVVGGPATVADALARFAEAGASHIVCVMPDAARPQAYELLADKVLPRLR